MTDWKNIVKTVAPGLAGLLGGPLAATAVGALSQSLLGKADGTETEIAAAVAGASPDVLAKIKQTEADLKVSLANAGVKLEDIAAQDRASARNLAAQNKSWTIPVLTGVYTLLYFLALWAVWRFGLPPEADTRAMLQTLLGVITTAQVAIIQFHFGSSAGSEAKNAIISKLSEP